MEAATLADRSGSLDDFVGNMLCLLAGRMLAEAQLSQGAVDVLLSQLSDEQCARFVECVIRSGPKDMDDVPSAEPKEAGQSQG